MMEGTQMPNYLLAYHGGGMPATEAERAHVMEAWGKWIGGLGAAMIDAGNPVGKTSMIAGNGAVSQGGGANPVSGYSVIKAENMDEAIRQAKGCPILSEGGGGSIEVCETFNAM